MWQVAGSGSRALSAASALPSRQAYLRQRRIVGFVIRPTSGLSSLKNPKFLANISCSGEYSAGRLSRSRALLFLSLPPRAVAWNARPLVRGLSEERVDWLAVSWHRALIGQHWCALPMAHRPLRTALPLARSPGAAFPLACSRTPRAPIGQNRLLHPLVGGLWSTRCYWLAVPRQRALIGQ